MSASTPEPGSITVRQAAKELGLNTKTVLARVHDGTIPAFKIAQGYRIRRADINALLERTAAHPDSTPAPLGFA